jgi:hypothetical protein
VRGCLGEEKSETCLRARAEGQLIETIEKLRLRGIGFRSLTESIDTTTAQGLLVFHMFSALAEFERSLIRERTRAGLAAAKRHPPPRCTDTFRRQGQRMRQTVER